MRIFLELDVLFPDELELGKSKREVAGIYFFLTRMKAIQQSASLGGRRKSRSWAFLSTVRLSSYTEGQH